MQKQAINSLRELGKFGRFGGRYVPETLVQPLVELERAYLELRDDPRFQEQLASLLQTYLGRPTPLTFAKRLTEYLGGPRIMLKREDLLHTGAHKINNTIGQAMIARELGKRRLIAETGAGQHGVATATAAALFGLECDIYMGALDVKRQELNVQKMDLLGARVIPVSTGARTLKEAVSEALRDWAANLRSTHYVLGSALGPHPYPTIVRDFQRVIGDETRSQFLDIAGKLPDEIVACVGGGSNAIGMFQAFLEDQEVDLVGVESGGKNRQPGSHAARFFGGSVGTLHGTMTRLLQDGSGQILNSSSIAPGLDYPAVGPEHAFLEETGRVHYTTVIDSEAEAAFQLLSKLEGILPALESAHAVAYVMQVASQMDKHKTIVINLSGRGDKDLHIIGKRV